MDSVSSLPITSVPLHRALYDMAGPDESATMLCPACCERTPVKQICILFGFQPECSLCGFVGKDDVDIRVHGPGVPALIEAAKTHAKTYNITLIFPEVAE